MHAWALKECMHACMGAMRVVIKRGTGNEEMGNGETWK